MAENYGIDQEMLGDFINESIESLSTIPGLFVEFEGKPDELNLVEAIFRPIHSLKGNAAYFGLMKIKALAHDMESVLDLLRKEKLLPDREIIDSLLAGVDELYRILEETRVSGKEVINPSYELAHQRVKNLLVRDQAVTESGTSDGQQLQKWQAVLEAFHELESLPEFTNTDAGSRLSQLEAGLWELVPDELQLVRDGDPSPVSSPVANPLHSLITLLQAPSAEMSKADESTKVLELLRSLEQLAVEHEAKKIVANSLDEYDLFVSRIGYDPMLKESLLEAVQSLSTLQEWASPDAEADQSSESLEPELAEEPATAEPSSVVETTVQAEAPTIARKEIESGRTMRISEERVDVFLSYVGELIAVDEMLRYIHSKMVRSADNLDISSSLLRIVNTFTKLSDDLQNSIMEIRKVSVKPMLQKTQRIVRDIAFNSEKLIDTQLHGEELTIDRSLVESLEAPMLHMIRNAADHGIENPQERIANGKPERGQIAVRISETEDMIVLSISDDGKGLNYNSIKQKAIKMGLMNHDTPVTKEVLKEVIFTSGFSTATEVTDLSGRGVGMDAVRRSVEDAGGHIEVKSIEGQGTEFLISLPKSVGTQILNSFVVQVGGDRFVLPMDKISGSFKPEGHFNRLPSGTVCIKRNDTILPVMCLDGPYQGAIEILSSGILVTIENKGNPFVFYVDTILGMQKVVLRHIPWLNASKFLGAAIMGDGHVSMIVNVEALAELTRREAA